MAVKAIAPADNRTHSAVYHKRDRRVNDIIRRCRKSDIISIYDIDCCMLFRVEQAHMEFDVTQNHRPYILFGGKAEGVFLPEKLGLLFPNMCDQLDFRNDYPVDAGMQYALSDLEIATLANNGLFNSDWSCQGRIIGALLEIPCKVDYSAVAGTPITFIEIQDRLSMKTSTMKTGYKTLVTAFLPYQAQKHNDERHASLVEGKAFDKSTSEIRRRSLYDTPAVGFGADSRTSGIQGGATFVEAAQARIQARLKEQMDKADILGTQKAAGQKVVGDTVSETVKSIQSQLDAQRSKAIQDADEAGTKLQTSVLDARLNDMSQKMIYAGAGEIPVAEAKAEAKSLAEPKPVGQNDETMCRPYTDLVGAPAMEDAVDKIDGMRQRMHEAVASAEETAEAVTKTLSRKEKLAQRRAERSAVAARAREAINKAATEEAAKGLDKRDVDRTAEIKDEQTGELKREVLEKKDLEGDILSEKGVDIDDVIRGMGMS